MFIIIWIIGAIITFVGLLVFDNTDDFNGTILTLILVSFIAWPGIIFVFISIILANYLKQTAIVKNIKKNM